MPERGGPHPAVVLGAEAYGVNSFIRGVQEKLVRLGYAVAVPDYYHGNGPAAPDDYGDFTEVKEHIGRLDFTRGARDLAAAVDALRVMPGIDPRRVAVWGYCTGGTLAWLAACLRGDLAAAVLYFPSQPAFAELSPARPVHPVDLLWQLTCPALFLYGDQDGLMSPARWRTCAPGSITGMSTPASTCIRALATLSPARGGQCVTKRQTGLPGTTPRRFSPSTWEHDS